jgi:hypothetical protein
LGVDVSSAGQRYYLACKVDEKSGNTTIIGFFSNQKNMMDAISESNISLDDAYIVGSRKNKEVTSASVSSALQSSINLTIMKNNMPYIKVLVFYMNALNPLFKKK